MERIMKTFYIYEGYRNFEDDRENFSIWSKDCLKDWINDDPKNDKRSMLRSTLLLNYFSVNELRNMDNNYFILYQQL